MKNRQSYTIKHAIQCLNTLVLRNFFSMPKGILQHISDPKDIRTLELVDLIQLAQELREFIIDIVATKEGHLGASLGVVELTIALHYVFNTPKDDFGTGHSSTSISAILGMALASQIKGIKNMQHIAVIGDASIASGMAFEGLNHAGDTNANILIILNDNAIGIDPSVGALKKYLTNVKKGTAKDENIFECLNFNYSGPMDGHDLAALIKELKRLKEIEGPKLLHIITTKGKGLQKAEENQVVYHAPGKFNKETGDLWPKTSEIQPPKYQDVFGHTLVELAENNEKIVGITPAMPTGSSLKYMMEKLPERAFDVGIAEQHAVTMAGGMAAEGLVPFCNIYSTFLQRAYDQIIHDVALQNLPVIFCLDRAGLVGQDGATHHGIYDMAYLRCIPNLIIFAPLNEIELRNIMFTAQLGLEHPIAIRYPRGRGVTLDWKQKFNKIPIGISQELKKGTKIAVLSIGHIGNMVSDLLKDVNERDQIGHYNMRFVKPLDTLMLHKIFSTYESVITIEDGCKMGGFGSAILEYANEIHSFVPIKIFGIEDVFIEQGTVEELHKISKIDISTLKNYINNLLNTD
mgnify:CR=1 FL=1